VVLHLAYKDNNNGRAVKPVPWSPGNKLGGKASSYLCLSMEGHEGACTHASPLAPGVWLS
jgi:hypothetical protein